MGDRANIEIKQSECGSIFLYTHWDGFDGCFNAVKRALSLKERWGDESYLTRIIFCQLIQGDIGTTGYGISTTMQDNENPIVSVDCVEQKVKIYGEGDAVYVKEWTFEEFTLELKSADTIYEEIMIAPV